MIKKTEKTILRSIVQRSCYFVLLIIFGELLSASVVTPTAGFNGSIWHDCINLNNEGSASPSPGAKNVIAPGINSKTADWVQNMFDSADYYLFYETPWPIQEQKNCQIIDQVIPQNCSEYDSSPAIYPILGNNPDGSCYYKCANHLSIGLVSFTAEDEENHPLWAHDMKFNQKHVASYGQGLMFIYARLVKDMLGQALLSGEAIDPKCNDVASCKEYCKNHLFKDPKVAIPYYGKGSDFLEKAAPTGPSYGYVADSDQTWILNKVESFRGDGPCEAEPSMSTDFAEVGITLNLQGDTEQFSVDGCYFKPTNNTNTTYFNPFQDSEKYIQPAHDSGSSQPNITMVDCICESLFAGAKE